jgi:hypothetical protein
MKSLIVLVVACLLILTARVAYNAGAQQQRDFETLCETPQVQCIVRFAPEYFDTHSDLSGFNFPHYLWGEFGKPFGGAL